MQRDSNAEISLSARMKATLIVGLITGMMTVGLAPVVGLLAAISIACVSVGVVGGFIIRFRLRWSVRPWVRRLFRAD